MNKKKIEIENEIEVIEKKIIGILRNVDTDEDTIRDIIDEITDLKEFLIETINRSYTNKHMKTQDNLKLIKNSIKELKSMSGDPEIAHSFEDDFYKSVLKDISNGAKDADKLAKEVLKASKVNFERYCA